jgi:putative acetyltransferase
MRIENASKKHYSQLIEIWETSVRSTHDFLTENDILSLRSLILEKYLPALELRCIRDKYDKICGFIGIAERKIEMLFYWPKFPGEWCW